MVKLRSTDLKIRPDMDLRIHKAQPLYSSDEKDEARQRETTCPRYQQVKRDGTEHQHF